MQIMRLSSLALVGVLCGAGAVGLQPRSGSADDNASGTTELDGEAGRRGDAQDRIAANPRTHQSALGGRIRRAPSGHSGGREDRPVPRKEVRGARSETGQHRRHLRAESTARRSHAERSAAAGRVEGLAKTTLQVVGRLRRLHQARRGDIRTRQHRHGLRRLRCRRAGIQLGRFQGARRQGQDDRRAGERPAGS